MDIGKFIICMVIVFSLVIGGDRSVEAQNSQINNVSAIYETVSSIKLQSQDICGRVNVTHNRTVGGTAAELGTWPWMAAIGYRHPELPYGEYGWMCAGSLISNSYVLTAASCNGFYTIAVVRLGDLNLDPDVNDGSGPRDYTISRVIIHGKYTKEKYTNGIALLELTNKVRFNQFIQSICLPILSYHRTNTFAESVLLTAEWFPTMLNLGSRPLVEFQAGVLNNSECQQKYNKYDVVIDDKHLCAEIIEKRYFVGMSGSPLIWASGTQYYVVGVRNFGSIVRHGKGFPDGYARVTSFVEWISDNMNK